MLEGKDYVLKCLHGQIYSSVIRKLKIYWLKTLKLLPVLGYKAVMVAVSAQDREWVLRVAEGELGLPEPSRPQFDLSTEAGIMQMWDFVTKKMEEPNPLRVVRGSLDTLFVQLGVSAEAPELVFARFAAVFGHRLEQGHSPDANKAILAGVKALAGRIGIDMEVFGQYTEEVYTRHAASMARIPLR